MISYQQWRRAFIVSAFLFFPLYIAADQILMNRFFWSLWLSTPTAILAAAVPTLTLFLKLRSCRCRICWNRIFEWVPVWQPPKRCGSCGHTPN